MDNLFNEIKKCQKCNNLEPWTKFNSNSHGNINSKYMLISEAPGTISIENQRYWTGISGIRIRNLLSEVSEYELEDLFYLTDIVKCYPPNNRTPNVHEINECKDYLKREIEIIRPKLIISFGSKVLKFMLSNYKYNCVNCSAPTQITLLHNNNGYRRFRFESFDLIPLLHPSAANRFMDYGIYKQQLKEIYQEIIENR